MLRLFSIAFLISVMTGLYSAFARAPTPAPAEAERRARPAPPTRDPHTPGYVAAKELPDGANAPTNADGNFILGPTHSPAPEMIAQEGTPQGTVFTFTMESAESKIYPGIAREPNSSTQRGSGDGARTIVTTSHPYTSHVAAIAQLDVASVWSSPCW